MKSRTILGVMSDTHGNRELMHHAADAMIQEHGASAIFHLGDDYADIEELRNAGYPVRGVPGLWCREYHDPRVLNALVENIDGLTVACAHAPQDLRGAAARARIILIGHTHRAEIRKLKAGIRVNPGHLKKELDRGEAASYAILALDKEQVRVTLREITGAVREERVFPRADFTEEEAC